MEGLASNCDDVSIWELHLLLVRTLARLRHLGVKVQSNVDQLLLQMQIFSTSSQLVTMPYTIPLEDILIFMVDGGSDRGQLFGRALTNASQHGVASREHDVVVQVLTNVHMMDWKVVLWGKEARQLWAVEAWLPTDVSIWKLEASSRCRSPKQWSTSLALEGGVVDAFVFLTMAGNARQNNRRASNWDDDSIYEFMKTETQRNQEHYFRHSTLLTICLKPAVMHSAFKPMNKKIPKFTE